MDKKRSSFTSRDLALVAGLTGLYLVYGYSSGVTFGHTILELDLFFLISALFTIVVSMTLSLIPNGLVFDLALYSHDHMIDELSRKRVVIAGALGNLAMAISGLVILQTIGFFQGKGLDFILATSVIALVTNPLVGAIGALFGTIVVRRVGERVRFPLIR